MKLSTAFPLLFVTAVAAKEKIVKIECDNLKFDSLDSNGLEKVGSAIEASYNLVHKNDDSEMTEIHPIDDPSGNLKQESRFWAAYYAAQTECNLCLDDDVMALETTKKLGTWSSELTKELKTMDAGTCKVKFYKETTDAELSTESMKDKIVKVECQNLKFDSLDSVGLDKVGAAIESSYNLVHKNDDSEMKSIRPTKQPSGNLEQESRFWAAYYAAQTECNLCLDDDAMALESTKKLGTWSSELTKELKSMDAGTCKVKFYKGAVDSKVSVEASKKEIVKIECESLDFGSLDTLALDKVGAAIESSYNIVHKNDDSEMTSIYPVGPTPDPDLSKKLKQYSRFWAAYYAAQTECNLCLDDDAMALESTKRLGSWSKEVTKALKSMNAGTCKVKFYKGEASAKQITVPAKINARCQGVNFQDLSTTEGEFASKAMIDAFNTVAGGHGAELARLTFSGPSKSFLRAAMGGSTSGEFSGIVLAEDFDATQVKFVVPENTVKNKLYKSWEVHFLAALLQSEHEVFGGVKACDLTLTVSTDESSS